MQSHVSPYARSTRMAGAFTMAADHNSTVSNRCSKKRPSLQNSFNIPPIQTFVYCQVTSQFLQNTYLRSIFNFFFSRNIWRYRWGRGFGDCWIVVFKVLCALFSHFVKPLRQCSVVLQEKKKKTRTNYTIKLLDLLWLLLPPVSSDLLPLNKKNRVCKKYILGIFIVLITQIWVLLCLSQAIM